MITKTAFFAILNDANNRIGVTAHIKAVEEANGTQSLIISQNGAPNSYLSNHKSHTTTFAAFKKYNAWLNEWFAARTAEAQARIDAQEASHAEALGMNASFGSRVQETSRKYQVQLRFAAMMERTGDYNTTHRGAEFVAFISDRKSEYKAAHPDKVMSDVICDHDHFTAFILSGVWQS